MITLDQITEDKWISVATRDYGHKHLQWQWKCEYHIGQIIREATRDGRMLSAQRSLGRGVYELLVNLPRQDSQVRHG